MAVIPRYDQQTTAPSAAGFTPVSGGSASPDAFGAGVGEAQSGLGRSLDRVGDQLYSAAQAFQQQENETAANEATTQFLVRQSALQEEFKLLQGKDPKEAMADYVGKLQALKTEMRGALSNPEVARMFDQATTRQFGYAVMNAGSYAATQYKQYQNAQYNARITATVHATSGAEDQKVFEKGLTDIEESVRQGELKGQSEEVIEGRIRDEQGKAWSRRLSDIAKNDPEAARAILSKNRSKIDGIVAQNAEDFINKMDVSRTSQRIANGVALGGATDTLQQREDYAMSYLTAKYGKAAAAGFVGNFHDESGLDPKAKNKQGNEGIAQWDLARRTRGKAWAEKNGLDWGDFKTQVQFIDHELQTTERATAEKLKGVTDPREAAKIIDQTFERSEGYSTARRSETAARIHGRTVLPVATMRPGNRAALESTAVQQAQDYATKNGLDQATTESLVETTRSRVDAIYGKQMATARDAAVGGKATLTQFVTNGPDGKAPVTDLEAVIGPQAPEEVRNAYLQLPPEDQKRVRDMVSRQAAATLTPASATEETKARRQQLQGMMIHDPNAFLNVDPTKEKLTRQDVQWLTSSQLRLLQDRDKKDDTATNTDRAMGVLRRAGLLNVNGLRPEDVKANPERWQQFTGGLAQLLDRYNLDHKGETPSEDDIKKMAKDLLTETVTSRGWIWNTKTPLYQQGPQVNNPPKMDAIPQEEINKIREALREAGNPNPSTQDIRRVYGKKLQRDKSANAQ